jgi:phosphoglycolate phosphatase
MRLQFKLLVFDWDGTLMDSETRIITSFQAAMRDTGLEELAAQRIRAIIGLGLPEGIFALFPDAPLQARQDLAEAYRQRYLHNPTPTPLFEGAEATLRELRRAGYLLGVATGKGRRGLTRALAETGLGDVFAASRCAEESRSKPEPHMLQEIMQELDVAPQQTLMIGDTEFDLNMANNAGAYSAAVSFGAHECERLRACRPLACLDRLEELLEWLAAR